MTAQQIPKYHIAPHFGIPPTEAGGLLELGSIIVSINNADDPINQHCHVRIPISTLFCSHQKGFSATRSSMTSGEYGIWARVFSASGGELTFAGERSVKDVYHFRSIDTIYFNPSQEYLEESMNKTDVKQYMDIFDADSLYMVTGLKTARGPSVQSSKSRKWANTVELGLQEPGGIPIELGPKFNTSKETRQEQGFEDSADFIVGIRVSKLMYKKNWKQWMTRKSGRLVVSQYDKGATMVDDDWEKNDDEVIELGSDLEDDDLEGQIQVETERIGEDTFQTAWLTLRN
ncbi:hypothetical protein K4K48_004749 [Colletotrichum sp. SAR 10_66]|nr:hypothetical protein K4K52_007343 [Colletotrichum sp. SAR 10_76]KAJ4998984.1 hypothetical protein K4K48_004749 [Colletotrichum sp. SAR 10_66]